MPLAANPGDAFSILIWLFVAIALVVVGMWAVRHVRSWSRQDERSEAFDMQGLRALRESEQLSAAEFEALRRGMIHDYKQREDDTPRAESLPEAADEREVDDQDTPDDDPAEP